MIQLAGLVTAFHDRHATILRRGVVEHHHAHHGEQIGVGVRKVREVLMPRERAGIFLRRLGGEFRMLQLHVRPDKLRDKISDARVARQFAKRRVLTGDLEQMNNMFVRAGVFQAALDGWLVSRDP